MLILGISTSTAQVGCAIGGHEGVISSMHVTRDRRHAETLAPAIDFVARQADIGLDEIGCVAVDVGPGLFTGLRVGIATAKAFAFARDIPMVGISSLDLLAFPVRFSQHRIEAVIDARRGEIYRATYRQVPGGVQRLGEPTVCTAEDLANELLAERDETLLVGDGAQRYRGVFDELDRVEIAEEGHAYPSAGSLVLLAHAQAIREEFVNSWQLEPMYLRKPDAEVNWQTRDDAGPR
jgi:tRNA threonylcarbamoyladenosine biosynthesis protein TsaB